MEDRHVIYLASFTIIVLSALPFLTNLNLTAPGPQITRIQSSKAVALEKRIEGMKGPGLVEKVGNSQGGQYRPMKKIPFKKAGYALPHLLPGVMWIKRKKRQEG